MIYILEFSEPLGSARHKAQYYIGYCKDGTSAARLKLHRAGQGAAITRAANERNIPYTIICLLDGDRSTERMLKRVKNTPRIIRQIRAKKFTLAKVRVCLWTD